MSEIRCMRCGQPIIQNLCNCGMVNNYPNLPYSYQPIQQQFIPVVQPAKRSILGKVVEGISLVALALIIISIFITFSTGSILFNVSLFLFATSAIVAIIDLAMNKNSVNNRKIISGDIIAIILGVVALVFLILRII